MKKKLITIICILVCLITQLFTPLNIGADKKLPKSKIMVSMGDSFSSGEGIEDFYGQDADDISVRASNPDWLAHRSEESWPGRLILPSLSKKNPMSYYKDTNWFFVASSEAETKHIMGYQNKKVNREGFFSDSLSLDPQINILNKLEKGSVDYVTLTLGGNDAKFSTIIKSACIFSPFLDTNGLVNELQDVWTDFYREGGIRDDLYEAYGEISDAAGSQAKIIVAGYPLLFSDLGAFLVDPISAALVNDSVGRFNDEIEALVNQCKAEGKKICFVDVEEKFDGHEAGSLIPYINDIKLGSRSQDLEDDLMASAYSIHPNKKGAEAYAKAVQEKINQIETEGEESEWPNMSGSEERDAVMVLDVSGSMDGTPLKETKEAAKQFINTISYEDAGIGIVAYDTTAMKISNISQNTSYLHNTIQSLNAGGSTNIEAGLKQAEEMLDDSVAKRKFIVLMSDGMPNVGKEGDALIQYASNIKEQGIRIYTLGFFSNLSQGERAEAEKLMKQIANEGCDFQIDDASQLVFFFDDIAEQIKGTKYYYIRVACPVDVTVEYKGEKLSSEDATGSQRSSFGSLTFEENPSDPEEPIKILRLKEGTNYNIHIEGTGRGTMNYTIGFMDAEGNYSDMREFEDVEITRSTEIDTVASNSKTTSLKVDEDGDGKYDYVYEAKENGYGEIVDYNRRLLLFLSPVLLLILLLIILIIVKKKTKKPALAAAETHSVIPSSPEISDFSSYATETDEKEVPPPVPESPTVDEPKETETNTDEGNNGDGFFETPGDL